MVKLAGSFSQLAPKKILVAGDLGLDSYIMGKARRISPEAPVAVVNVRSEEDRPGMAGNTLLNLISLGAEVRILSRIGKDLKGQLLIDQLKKEKVDTQGIFVDTSIPTPQKTRIIADFQQIVRVDHEITKPVPQELEKKILRKIPSLLEGIDVLAISDYGKGFLTDTILQALIQEAKAQGIYIIVDPKGIDYTKYAGVDLIKPNLSESYAAANLPLTATLDEVSKILFKKVQMRSLLITRSEEGISLFFKNQPRQDFPVKAKQVIDVTGAGDTVLAVLAFSIANKLSLPEAIQFANIAAGIAIEQLGCARVSLHQLAKRLLQEHVTNKIFDANHLHVLKAALLDAKCRLFTLPPEQMPSAETLSKIIKHKQETNDTILLVCEKTPSDATIDMLTSLQPIDFVIINTSKKLVESRLK